MRISLNWLKEYVNITISDDELIRLIGARLVEVEGVIDESHKYDNIMVVRVEKAEKIPDTHLTLCQIYDGGPELIQVVCGAPNVREGMLAAWIKPGAIVPASVHEDAPFVIGKRKMLNKYDSCGMLAGADELDFGGDHSGIAEIDPNMANPGDALADVFKLNDKILEIENKSLTHRPDTFGIIGFAREVAGILGQAFDEPEFLFSQHVFEEGFLVKTERGIRHIDSKINIEVEEKPICNRYTAAVIKVSEATSAEKYLSNMRVLLCKSGMQSVSRIVDVTNYMMLLTGQPLHAFDFEKFLAIGKTVDANIIVRVARDGEKLELIDGSEVVCNSNDILITSNNVPVALAGAMGGKNTEIDENTKIVLLESASFSLYNLRKTQMAHGIFSEAITRFTKGVPAGGTFNVLSETISMLNGKPLDLNDAIISDSDNNVVKITTDEINDLLGTKYERDLIIKTLQNVYFKIETNGDLLLITAPYWRTDIHIKEDIIEEVGRLLGYDNIAPTLPLHATATKNPMFELKSNIRELFSNLGANELLTYSFVSEQLLKDSNLDPKNSYKIVNSISPELQYFRQSIVPSLLDKTYLNEKLPVDRFAIFEMNKVYQKNWGLNDENVPVEKNRLGFVVAERKGQEGAFYLAKKYAEKLFEMLQVQVKFVPIKNSLAETRPFEEKKSAEIRLLDNPDVMIGVVGEFKKSVQSAFKLADFLAGFEVDLDTLLEASGHEHKIDLCKVEKRDLTIATTDTYQRTVDRVCQVLKKNNLVAKITPGTIYQPDGDDKKHITIHLEFKNFNESVMQELENL